MSRLSINIEEELRKEFRKKAISEEKEMGELIRGWIVEYLADKRDSMVTVNETYFIEYVEGFMKSATRVMFRNLKKELHDR
jgi:hypothetical protein